MPTVKTAPMASLALLIPLVITLQLGMLACFTWSGEPY
jgi:hypothetical protein